MKKRQEEPSVWIRCSQSQLYFNQAWTSEMQAQLEALAKEEENK